MRTRAKFLEVVVIRQDGEVVARTTVTADALRRGPMAVDVAIEAPGRYQAHLDLPMSSPSWDYDRRGYDLRAAGDVFRVSLGRLDD